MPSRVSAAPFWAPRSETAIAVNPASASSSIGVGTAGSLSQPATSRRVCPEVAAARNRAASRSWAAGPHRSRRCSSATVSTKCPASRCASSTVARPCSGFHHQVCGWWVMRCGSNSHTRPPAAARSLRGGGPQVGFVARWRSPAPGADSTNGIACAVVFPVRGRHERHHRVFPARDTPPVRAGAGAQQPAERQPGLGRVQADAGPRRPGTGGAGAAARAAGSRVSAAMAGLRAERGDRVTGHRPMRRAIARPASTTTGGGERRPGRRAATATAGRRGARARRWRCGRAGRRRRT